MIALMFDGLFRLEELLHASLAPPVSHHLMFYMESRFNSIIHTLG